MVGCVWQWCCDAADEHADIEDTDPFVDPEDYEEQAPRVTRGGAWNTLPWSLTCTSRNGYPPTARFSNLGFRCVSGDDPGRV
jgi:formylglycine-generating enzyme required for sulfatase activity